LKIFFLNAPIVNYHIAIRAHVADIVDPLPNGLKRGV
jgi:hypothetical protein